MVPYLLYLTNRKSALSEYIYTKELLISDGGTDNDSAHHHCIITPLWTNLFSMYSVIGETRAPGENRKNFRENMQIPHRFPPGT